ncbi:actin-like [Mytilus edulis]|uniref:actin-like n=1 Tax=Mytilus edulis TaxID=6550 RepID=UPI0039EFB99F
MSTVVVDNGSYFCRAGFAGEDKPRSVFPAVVGTLKQMGVAADMYSNPVYIGSEFESKKKEGLLTVKYPTYEGYIVNWDDMEHILNHTFNNELGIATEEHSILLTEPPQNPKPNREKMTMLIFETFNFPAMYVKAKGVLSLYSSGCITGVALDICDGTSYSLPAYEGYALRHAVKRSPVSGEDITNCLQRSLDDRSYSFTSLADIKIIRDIKENMCYVASDYKKEMEWFSTEAYSLEKNFELPDGQIVNIGSEQIRCVETLFQPLIMGMQFQGLHETLNDSILKCDKELHKDLYENIVLCGESSRTPGITERMRSEITKLAPLIKKINVKTPPDIKNSAWVGGSILASLPTFQGMCITKEEYDEIGPRIVINKCF